MILPSSKEEDKLLKKRYAVFNEDGSLAELKGFEVKRRGELQLIKIFQSQIFEQFLLGSTLTECYAEVAKVANQWLDILQTKGASLSDDELVDLIAENRSMSRTLSEYAGQKSTSISTAKRLSEFLGEGMVKDKGLACKFIISAKPIGAPVTERAVPVAIFSAEDSIKRHFLRKWLKDNSLADFEMRSILDWDYYIERLGSVVQKLITIPAAMQKVSNPVPRIRHPDWLLRRVANLEDRFKQHKLSDMFSRMRAKALPAASSQAPQLQEVPGADAHQEGDGATEEAADIAPKEVKQKVVVEKPAPPITKDYGRWVKHMKKVWKKKREQKKEAAAAGISRAGGRLGNMFKKQTFSLTSMSHTWEILQISEMPNGRPGEYKMWLLIKDTLQSVKLRIPRTFYLNFKKLDDADQVFPAFCD
jgi:DNA polymerase epsilon subunit 1